MRNDLEKVLTERARWGVSYYRNLPNEYRKAKRFKLDEELEVDAGHRTRQHREIVLVEQVIDGKFQLYIQRFERQHFLQ